MPRFHHGCAFTEGEVAAEAAAGTTTGRVLAMAAAPGEEESRFGFLFPKLQEKNGSLLTEGATTVEKLDALGKAMADTSMDSAANNSKLPAVFTYFGQFVAHDITWEKGTKDITSVKEIRPWDPDQVRAIVNKRTGSLDLDCIYGDSTFEVPCDKTTGTLNVDHVAHSAPIPPGKDLLNDVPRIRNFRDPENRRAKIGDPRNDENTIISQLHVAFLRAHNELVKRSAETEPLAKFDDARTKLIQLYQTILVEDYLKRIIRPDVFSGFFESSQPFHDGSFMPIEFSAAAFRFGHTMIRTSYALNRNFIRDGQRLRLGQLFDMPPVPYHNLQASWIIEWENFTDGKTNLARQITTQMVEPLSLLKDSPNNPFKDMPRLAVRDLLRGYIFRLPTGQAVAREIGVNEEEIITGEKFHGLVHPSQLEILSTSELGEKTPLWFYILAEAAREKIHKGNDHLGPVGGCIVASVLRGSLLKSANSILQTKPSPLGSTLTELFDLAGVLSEPNLNQ